MLDRKNMNKYINDFLEYMEVEKGDSLLSVRNYHHYLKRFAYFAKENKVEKPENFGFG